MPLRLRLCPPESLGSRPTLKTWTRQTPSFCEPVPYTLLPDIRTLILSVPFLCRTLTSTTGKTLARRLNDRSPLERGGEGEEGPEQGEERGGEDGRAPPAVSGLGSARPPLGGAVRHSGGPLGRFRAAMAFGFWWPLAHRFGLNVCG